MGVSIGLSRVMAHLSESDAVAASRETASCVLIILGSEADRLPAMETSRQLRQRGIPCEVYPAARKIDRQIQYASSIGIPYAWFPESVSSTGHQSIRDLRTGDQADADPATWTPADERDLRPVIRGE